MDNDANKIRLMLQGGMCCSQIIVSMGLSLRGETNESMITAASGLCMGLHAGQVCGTLSAACLVLAMFDPKNAAEYMIPQLFEWYEDTYGPRFNGLDCAAITGGRLKPDICRDVLEQTWKQVRLLLEEFGFSFEPGTV